MGDSEFPLGASPGVHGLAAVAPVDGWHILVEVSATGTSPSFTVGVCGVRGQRGRCSERDKLLHKIYNNRPV